MLCQPVGVKTLQHDIFFDMAAAIPAAGTAELDVFAVAYRTDLKTFIFHLQNPAFPKNRAAED